MQVVDAPLVAEGFGRRYSHRRPWAVREVSFAIPAGSITALVGPNGAGKSTLMRACIGFERPDAGRLLVLGVDPTVDRVAAVNSIGYVPQSAALYRNLTIGDHLWIARAARMSFDRVYARRRIADAGLSEDRAVGDLSGGERAQVSLAIALGLRAPLLLLDEPLASLDPLARRDFLTTVVDDIRERGGTAVLSSHIVTDVEQACDWLMVLSEGHVALHEAVTSTLAAHRTVSNSDAVEVETVGTFSGPNGELLSVTRDPVAGRASSLEEVVLAYLAAARAKREGRTR